MTPPVASTVDPVALLRRLRRRARLAVLVEGLATLLVAALAWGVASYVADRTFELEVGYRVALGFAGLATLVVVARRRLWGPIGAPLDEDEMALAVERADPRARQALISAVQFERALDSGAAGAESPEMMRLVVEEARRRVARLETRRALDAGRVVRFATLGTAVLSVAAACVAAFPASVGLWARRNLVLSDVPWPRATTLRFEVERSGSVLRVPEGDDLSLRVRALGVVPERVVLRCRSAAGESVALPMGQAEPGVFVATLSGVMEDARLRAEGGDGVSEELELRVVPRPRVVDARCTLVLPDYLGLPPRELGETEGDLEVLEGSRLRVEARSTKPLRGAFWVLGDGAAQAPLAVRGDTRIIGELRVERGGLYGIHVEDEDGLDAALAPRWFVRVVPDREPTVEYRVHGVGAMITANARIPGRVLAKDDYAVTALAAFGAVADSADVGGEDAGRPVEFAPIPMSGLEDLQLGEASVEVEGIVDLEVLARQGGPAGNGAIRPGTFLSIRLEAEDNFGPKEPHRGRSETLTFRIVRREKLMEDLARRQAEQRRELLEVLEGEQVLRAEVAEILSPATDDPRAGRARTRLASLAKRQDALGRRVEEVARRYGRILAEMRNNRIMEPQRVAAQHSAIPAPLERLAKEDFPASSAVITSFGETGQDDVRQAAVASCDAILAALRRVLAQMQELESLAALLEGLRRIIRVQDAAIEGARARRDAEAEDLFGPDKGETGKEPNQRKR